MASARENGRSHPEPRPPGGSALLEGWSAVGAGKPRKRSLSIAGHRTAISLEEPFWEALRRIAWDKRVPIARLVAEIDAARGETSLSSAIRLFVLHSHARDKGV